MMNNAKKLLNNMFLSGDRVLVGLSGGADSVALLCLLKEIKDDINIELFACHINHSIRGEEALNDQMFCQKLCEKIGVKLYTFTVDIPKIASEKSISEETAGREERYRIFEELAEKLKAKIAVAHNQNDLAETVIFNLVRGSTATGLCSLKAVRDNIYRPLITTTRSQIEEYLKDISQEYRTDSTNKDDNYTRNKIRHCVIPQLEGINNKAIEHIMNLSQSLEKDCDYLDAESRRVYKDYVKSGELSEKLLEKPEAISSRVLALYLKAFNTEITRSNIEALKEILISGGKVNLSGNVFFEKRGEKIVNIKETETLNKFKLNVGENCVEKLKITLSFVDLNGEKGYNEKSNVCVLDADKTVGDLYLRSRENGDKFTPKGRPSKTLKKFLNEKKIPPEKRNAVPIISDDNGIVAVLPNTIDGRVAPTLETKRILIIKMGENIC